MKNNLEKTLEEKIKTGELKMKPKIYFYVGSFLLGFATLSFILMSIFLTSFNFYRFRIYRFLFLPWKFVLLNLIILGLAFYFLKKYDFSYKKNLSYLLLGFLSLIILGALIFDMSGLHQRLERRQILRKIYEHRVPMERLRQSPVPRRKPLHF